MKGQLAAATAAAEASKVAASKLQAEVAALQKAKTSKITSLERELERLRHVDPLL